MRVVDKSTQTQLGHVLKKKLAELRHGAGLNQKQLAERLNREPSFIARLELGERRLDVVEFFWVCRAMKLDPIREITALYREYEKLERFPSLRIHGTKPQVQPGRKKTSRR